MNAFLLVILLAHGGYWYGGVDNTVNVRWAAPEANMPRATLSWQLMFQSVVVSSGSVDVEAGKKSTTLTLQLPAARVITAYAWKYQLKNKDTGKEMESGERAIFLCPPRLLAGQAQRVKNKRIVVIDGQKDGLTAQLKDAGIEAARIGAIGDLQLRQPDIILVAENQLPENPVAQEILRTRAQAGARVVIFAQQKIRASLGFPLRSRPIKEDLVWRTHDELLDHFPAAQLNAWAREYAGGISALSLAADAPVLELGSWPRQTPGDAPVPVDALVATQTVGQGRIVWWQIPLGDFNKQDPRPRVLLADTLDYLLTPPEPTLSQVQRWLAARLAKEAAAGKNRPAPNLITGDKP